LGVRKAPALGPPWLLLKFTSVSSSVSANQ
jgi:hypothetical protein